ncbi:MAG: 30S ribosomal protein S20 [Wenzhouxiangellaceae bacterium]|nr:30S ribosomal protein S20 [Wenzhouxiangellaceae bacterium]
MANSASARKRARQAERNRRHNAAQRSYVRTMIKNVVNAVKAGDAEQAESAYRKAVPAIDKAVSKGIMHGNKAARHKSRLNRHIVELRG